MLYLLSQVLHAVNKGLEKPAARARLRKKETEFGLKKGEPITVFDKLGIALPERDARHLHPEIIRRLANGRMLYEDMRQAGDIP